MSTITAENRVATAAPAKRNVIRKLFEWGGFGAGAILVAFGVVAIVMGFSGRSTVSNSLRLEKIVGSPDMTPALIAKEALGLNIKVKDGFSGAAGMFFAMMDGDLDGQVIGLNSLIANQPQLWRTNDVRPLLQFGRRTRHPLLKDVPLASEYTKDGDALRLVGFAEAPLSMALPFMAPASLRAERARMLQQAFMSMMRDRDFLADAARVKLDITPVSGERVRQIIIAMAATPKALIARYNAITTV